MCSNSNAYARTIFLFFTGTEVFIFSDLRKVGSKVGNSDSSLTIADAIDSVRPYRFTVAGTPLGLKFAKT
jgi:hypothetical protein